MVSDREKLAAIGDTQHKNILDIDHVEYLVSGVKFSFYACPKYSPVSMPVEYLNNLRLADVKSIGAMKMEVLLRRSNFRDYYDIYSILKSGVPINDLVSLALTYSGHKLKSKTCWLCSPTALVLQETPILSNLHRLML